MTDEPPTSSEPDDEQSQLPKIEGGGRGKLGETDTRKGDDANIRENLPPRRPVQDR